MDEFEVEILEIIRKNERNEVKKEDLAQYHEHDIAAVFPTLSEKEKRDLLTILGKDRFAEVLLYLDLDQLDEETSFLNNDELADLVEVLDSDDAIDLLENLPEERKAEVYRLMDETSRKDAAILLSYDEDQIGSKMTNNYITIFENDTLALAKDRIVASAPDNDNITTIFVLNEKKEYCGAVELKAILCAKKGDHLEDMIQENYPTVLDIAPVSEVINDLKEYGEEIIPVVDEDDHLVGVITSSDIVEVVTEENNDDYSKLAGLTENSDLSEPVGKSMKKRIPWLLVLLGFDLVVSLLLSSFEHVIAMIAILVSFQPMILDMAGNSGTQTLAITIRVLTDEEVDRKLLRKLFFKEFRVGFFNGILLGLLSLALSFAFLAIAHTPEAGATIFDPKAGIYTWASILKISGVVGLALFVSIVFSTLTGSLMPMFFKKIHIDPAVASGPFITSLNDLIAILVYYGTTYLMFIQLFEMA